jgi:hypothetical protein
MGYIWIMMMQTTTQTKEDAMSKYQADLLDAISMVDARHHTGDVVCVVVTQIMRSDEARGMTAREIADIATEELDAAEEEWTSEMEYQRTLKP